MVLAFLGLHAALAVASPMLWRWLRRRAIYVAGIAPASYAAWAAAIAPRVIDGDPWIETLRLAPSLGVELAFRIDTFGLVMSWVVTVIGVLVFSYSSAYFEKNPSGLTKFNSWMLVFGGSMLGVVVSDNLLGLFVFWEATSIASYMLIGFDDSNERARAGALQALLTTGLGGLAMLAGFVIVGHSSGTYSLSALIQQAPHGRLVDVASFLILLGAFTKSAQVPFHSWLPSAMAAPTPVSAYLHAATMVKAGVILVARLTPAFASSSLWRPLCVAVGLSTMLLGAYRALRQFDLKLLLAYGTASQLGAMIALFGLGTPKATLAGVVLVLTHAMYKAAVFMSTGIVDKCTGTRDIRELEGIGRQIPHLPLVTATAAASMAGLPPLVGFIAKEEMLKAFVDGIPTAYDLPYRTALKGSVLALAVVSSAMTLAYAARFVGGTFRQPTSKETQLWGTHPNDAAPVVISKPSFLFIAPPALLAALGLAIGVFSRPLEWIAVPAASALEGLTSFGTEVSTVEKAGAAASKIALWHGLDVSLALSATSITAGFLLYLARVSVEKAQNKLFHIPGSLEGYRAALDGVLRLASRLTGIVQCGSLPVYLSVIALSAILLPAVPLTKSLFSADGLQSAAPSGPLWMLVGATVITLALGVATAKRRFRAVLMLGGVGYGVGILFVMWGAPDLALTQFLVETLMVIVFVLVLRHLPAEFSSHLQVSKGFNAIRLAMAGLVGAFVYVFSSLAVAWRNTLPISGEYAAKAASEAHGKNVVNMILVDFRAFDTMGEITVLVIAAIGIAALAAAAGVDRSPKGTPTLPSLILETGSRAVFHTILLLSIFIFFSGHNAPGGGFIAGLVAGGAFVVRYLAYGSGELQRNVRIRPETLMGAGLLVALGSGVTSLVRSEAFDFRFISLEVPLLKEIATSTSLLFDVGVFLAVVGLLVSVIQNLGLREVK